jgi:hypothetical protein
MSLRARRFSLRLLRLAVAAIVIISGARQPACSAAEGPGNEPLRTLRKQHPRIILLPEDLDRVRKLLEEQNPQAVKLHEALRRSAERMLKEPPVEYKLIGPRLLDKSRTALRRITTLAGLYRLDGDKAFADRAVAEMLAVSAFADWHPAHFLDTAEMTAADAIGYDWLFDILTPEQRKIIRDAIRDRGLKPGLSAYTAKTRAFWTRAHHNWAQVCGGGLTVGALAIADDEPEISADIVKRTYKTVVGGIMALSPDGGCPEGPGYWNYATQYTVYYLAAVQSALGVDWGMGETPGLSDTGLFPIHSTGPSLIPFDYADAHEGRIGAAPQLFWLSRRFNRPVYAAFERIVIGSEGDPFDLFWFDPRGQFPAADLPRDAMFGHIGVACIRGSWTDPNTTYVGFKGGDNRANHSHLDLGEFVLDALGHRWAVDLGADDYNLPGYFGSKRWTYYRLRTEGHNTLVLDGENQDPAAGAPLIAYMSTPGCSFAVTDLSAAYKKATSVLRGVELLDGRRVVVEDELRADKPLELVWNFHTRAAIQCDAATATLTEGTAKLEAKILSPAGAHFDVISANPPSPQHQQPDVHNLIIRLKGVTTTRLVVLLTPISADAPQPVAPEVSPLSQWIARGRLAQPAGQNSR